MIIIKKKFHQLVDKTIEKIEKYLDNYQGKLDIDYEKSGNTTKINIKSKNEIIITRQEFLQQIWIATQYKGYYFKYKNNKWICQKKYELFDFLKKFFLKKTKENIFGK
ncbi:iron donor protein CyaY [Buchnera aphidicola]|uniref:iron donor protein CyaY n=1 Tax=Buchnera aphidicola TaxID=9 RepID=UPI0020937A20|nr:iron donor protein CyaY [Buchnera aphidicola]USS94124.1 iron donor protein CyaY [Buchnera aphidicola (Sipha maydis)]WII23671.1 iron donor protein CyaY [Buchnera aphidicola (Sipha maydis)]